MQAALLVRGARRADIPGNPEGWLAVGDGGIIAAEGIGTAPAGDYGETVDAGGVLLFPGLIDAHAHYREPGLTHKGSIATESRAALAGGITSFFDMPNTVPPTVAPADIEAKKAIAAAHSAINYAFFPAATAETANILRDFTPGSIPGVKLFLGSTTGGLGAPEGAALDAFFAACARFGLPIMVHAEDNAIIAANTAACVARYGSREAVPTACHAQIRSREACVAATRRVVALARRHGARLHIAHVSTADEVELLEAGSPEAKLITAETTAMYLDPVFCTETAHADNRLKINPAIKYQNDRRALLEALSDGRIDTIGTDHAPHLLSEKGGGALTAASGAPSAQFALPVMLGYLSPELICRRMAEAPARIFGLKRRGCLKEGYIADFSLVATGEPHTITDGDVLSPCGWTPFAGRKVGARVERVWLAGREAYSYGRFSVVVPEELVFGV